MQPIVENAVRYGIKNRKNGVTVKIETSKNERNMIVKICDDGIGFDLMKKHNDGRKHIGIENVSNRLKSQCNAEVVIDSVRDVGTEVKIIIPRDKQGDTCENYSCR